MKRIKVSVSVTYSKEVEINVIKDYTDKDLRDAVRKQIPLPEDIEEALKERLINDPAIKDVKFKRCDLKHLGNWVEDDFAVVENNYQKFYGVEDDFAVVENN